MNDYVSKTNDILCEMRLVVEGAIVLYEDEATPLYNMALKAEMHEAAAAFDIIGRHSFPCGRTSSRWTRLAARKP